MTINNCLKIVGIWDVNDPKMLICRHSGLDPESRRRPDESREPRSMTGSRFSPGILDTGIRRYDRRVSFSWFVCEPEAIVDSREGGNDVI